MLHIGIVPKFEDTMVSINDSYINMFNNFNNVTIILLIDHNQINELDGLFLMGGNDEIRRDTLEFYYINECLDRDIPIFGVCKGMQMINLALGGTLKRVSNHHISNNGSHSISIKQNTIISKILNNDIEMVNSRHNEAINNLGEDLVISSVSSNDGVIEAIELPARKFVLGVQWHPEDINGIEFYKAFLNSIEK